MLPDKDTKNRYEQCRWHVYLSGLLVHLVATAMEVAFYKQAQLAPYLYVISGLGIIVGISWWCIYDSKARAAPLSQEARWGLWGFGPIFVPVYFWRTRGAREGIKSIFGLALFIPFYGGFYATWFLTSLILKKLGYFSPE
jgi:uncharacterized membrane protein